MPNELWSVVAAVVAVLVVGAIPVAGWFFAQARQPCPHCGRKASRTLIEAPAAPGVLGAHPLTYACRACGGEVRYARKPDGREFWEPIIESS